MINFESLAAELLKDGIVMERYNESMEEAAISWVEYADSIGMDYFAPEMYLDEDEEGICITSIQNSRAHSFSEYETVTEMADDLKKTMRLFYEDL